MKIGIVGWKVGENSFGVTVPYLDYFGSIKDAKVSILMPWSIERGLDLVVLPGGPDITPSNYGMTPSLYTGKACLFREHFDRYHLPKYIEMGTPIFGICRGMQTIAVHFGGRLYQHMSHETSSHDKRWEEVHDVHISQATASLLNLPVTKKDNKYKVNSLHHQIVIADTLPAELKVIGRHRGCNYGGVEIIAHTSMPIAGVQYHPEEMIFDDLSDAIIEKLLHTKQSILVDQTVEHTITAE
jgi:putative glutamine amidotransferase